MSLEAKQSQIPLWYWVLAGLGLLWSIFGAVQFFQSVISTKESLVQMGMTVAQAEVMKEYPMWMTLAFALGTFGGIAGCVLLLLRNQKARMAFTISLAGYIVLYIGDITEGVFAALGQQQVIILSTVVVVAVALLGLTVVSGKKGYLK